MKMKNLKKSVRALTIALAVAVGTVTAQATGGLGSSTVVTGTRNLINDATTILAGMSIAIGGGFMTYFLIRRGMADETDGKMWQKRAITAAVCGIGGVLASGIIAVIAGYYGA